MSLDLLDPLLHGWPLLVSSAVLGLIIGSFLNVVIYRLPIILKRAWRAEWRAYLESDAEAGVVAELPQDDGLPKHYSLVRPLSTCPTCNKPIRPQHNIPLLSYLWLHGRCACKKVAIGWQYPAVELLTAVLTVLVVWQWGVSVQALAALGVTWALLVLAGIDLKTQFLPDSICLPLLWLGLIFNYFGVFTDLESAFWGAVAGYLSLWAVCRLHGLVTRWLGNDREGMGRGDFKLLAALGAWLGWQALPMVVLLASLSGLSVAAVLLVCRAHRWNVPIAFGPYLALGGWLGLVFGAQIAVVVPLLAPF